jgi:hypothetical protein
MEQWSVGVLENDWRFADLTLLQYSIAPTLLIVTSFELEEQ